MIFELHDVTDFFSCFGDGYCVEMPTDQDQLGRLLDFLCAQRAQWRFYATCSNGNWFHGVHIAFPKNTDTDAAMRHVCELLGIDSYCVVEGGTQTVVDTSGDVLAFADFTERHEDTSV